MSKLIPISIIALTLTACSATGKNAGAGDNAAAPDTLTVMSFNIRMSQNDADGANHWQNRKEAVVKLIQTEHPAIVGMQEVCPDQMAYLDSCLTGYAHVGTPRDDGKALGETMAIFYDTARVDLSANRVLWLSETPDKVSKGWDAACNRTLETADFTIKPSGRKLAYFNTHLDHVGPEARKNSILLIVDEINKTVADSIPFILSADFNTNAADVIFDPLKAVAKVARVESPKADSVATYNGFGDPRELRPEQERVIDHFFFKNATPLEFRTLTGDYGVPYISDHYPITFTLVIQ